MAALKIFLDHSEIGNVDLDVGTDNIFGRQNDCKFPLDSYPGISRHHFNIYYKDQSWHVKSLSDKNPLWIAGKKTEETSLHEESTFELKPYRFELVALTDHILDKNQFQTEHASGDEITKAGMARLAPYLQITQENGETELLRLEGEAWIAGRDPLGDIVLPDESASRKQFEIYCNDNLFYIRDLDSSNGTLLNGSTLRSDQPRELQSGDVIEVNRLQIHFQFRDSQFNEKLQGAVESLPSLFEQNLSSHGYDSTYATSDETIDPLEPQARSIQGFLKSKKIKPTHLIMAILVVVIAVKFFWPETTAEKTEIAVDDDSPDALFAKLTEQQKNMIIQSYSLASNLMMQEKYEMALSQLEKIHAVLPGGYQKSKEFEEQCIESRRIRQQLEDDERIKQEQIALSQKVQETIAFCRPMANRFQSSEDVRGCLAPASDLDPNHPEVVNLIQEVEARLEQQKIAEEQRREFEKKVAEGVLLYEKAQAHHVKGEYPLALEAYQEHIDSTFPDPQNLKLKSTKAMKAIERSLENAKKKYRVAAKAYHREGKLAKAIIELEKALEIDPSDDVLRDYLETIRATLNNRLKNIYTDSILEERFGNIDAAKEKWRIILTVDTPNGDYSNKAKGKLGGYGAYP